MKEKDLLAFILVWAGHNSVPSEEVGMVLEYIRFTKLSLEDFNHFVNLPEMSPFWERKVVVESLMYGALFHKVPQATWKRRSGRLEK